MDLVGRTSQELPALSVPLVFPTGHEVDCRFRLTVGPARKALWGSLDNLLLRAHCRRLQSHRAGKYHLPQVHRTRVLKFE